VSSFRADTSEFKPSAVRLGTSRTYATVFPGTENPLSESGTWINGGTTGIDWRDVRCTPGFAFGTGPSASPPYDDPTAILSGPWGAIQTAEATVRVDAIEAAVNQEVEIRLLTTIAPNRILGYEVMWSITTNTYIDIRRWDGTTDLSSYVQIGFLGSGTSPQLLTGYRIKATIDATGTIRAYTDSGGGYALMLTSTADLTYRSGAPGIGYFKHAGAAGALSGYGLSAFSCSATSA
jgi:hypothetical protein